ncbi:MAG TPA: flavin reductase family protein [Longimicrobium sp.]|jgi:flavin reductase (NADH)|uniref:flavin reductase family protein n=1 Tax=Longimicrobium sp. TaxID=2029185 RepID=UPI002EDA9C85
MARPIQPTIRTHAGESAGEGVTPEEFRDAVSYWATGVAVLAVREDDDVEAITVTAFTPLSANPPLVLACVGNDAAALYMVLETGRFTLNLLALGDRRAASAYAQRLPLEPSPFEAEGDPVLRGAPVSLVCRLWETHPGGDHRVVIGQVERVVRGGEGAPLLYYRRGYRALENGED